MQPRTRLATGVAVLALAALLPGRSTEAQTTGQTADSARAVAASPSSTSSASASGSTTGATSPSTAPWRDEKNLRVCADPDNLPSSNEKQEGFDNKIAQLIAKEMGDSVSYLWWPQRRGFVRNTLRARLCDVLLGVPKGYDPVATTSTYYRSTYYIVSRTDRHLNITSLDDPRLKNLKIGVQLIGENYTNTPPAHALSARGMIENVVGFSSFYGEEHHPGESMDALAKGNIDVAILWGPLAGYFAKKSGVPMTLVPLPDADGPELPFAYDIAVGVRRSDKELKAKLDEILTRKRPEIEQILREYGVPTLPMAETPASPSSNQ